MYKVKYQSPVKSMNLVLCHPLESNQTAPLPYPSFFSCTEIARKQSKSELQVGSKTHILSIRTYKDPMLKLARVSPQSGSSGPQDIVICTPKSQKISHFSKALKFLQPQKGRRNLSKIPGSCK